MFVLQETKSAQCSATQGRVTTATRRCLSSPRARMRSCPPSRPCSRICIVTAPPGPPLLTLTLTTIRLRDLQGSMASPATRPSSSGPRRSLAHQRWDLTAFLASVNLERAPQPISGSFCLNCFKYDICIKVLHLTQTFLGQRLLPEVHQVGQQGEGHLQAGGQQGGVQAVGAAQEQTRHEL